MLDTFCSVFDLLGLDHRTRKLFNNQVSFKVNDKVNKKLRNINKGLTMELLTGFILTYIDSPTEVHPKCTVTEYDSNKVRPKNCAQGGQADVIVDYPEFILLLEVSAKSQTNLKFYKGQIENAIKHARELRKEGEKRVIHCLLVNERSLSIIKNMEVMEEVSKIIKPNEKIYLSGLSIEEFSNLGIELARRHEIDTAELNSKELFDLFNQSAVNNDSNENNLRIDEIIINFMRDKSKMFW